MVSIGMAAGDSMEPDTRRRYGYRSEINNSAIYLITHHSSGSKQEWPAVRKDTHTLSLCMSLEDG